MADTMVAPNLVTVTMTVNGKEYTQAVEPRTLLVHFIRENLGLTGTHIGCDTSSCGACTVHMDGSSVKSCTVLAVQADGAEITTIEGLGAPTTCTPSRKAFGRCTACSVGIARPA